MAILVLREISTFSAALSHPSSSFSGGFNGSDDFLTTISSSPFGGTHAAYSAGQNTNEAKLIFDGNFLYSDDGAFPDGYTFVTALTLGTVSSSDNVIS